MRTALLVVAAATALILAGVYVEFGVGWTLLVGGGLLLAGGLLIDLETE